MQPDTSEKWLSGAIMIVSFILISLILRTCVKNVELNDYSTVKLKHPELSVMKGHIYRTEQGRYGDSVIHAAHCPCGPL